MLPQQEQLKTSCCCHCKPVSPIKSRRHWDVVTGGLSLIIWILIPKCPVCLAAWMALWTGVGISFTQATYLRWLLMSVSISLLCYLALKHAIQRVQTAR